ncbi:unnamed protein product [Ixodes hexagonus]
MQYLKQNFGELCRLLEPVLGVRLKEEIATGLVSVMHRENMAREFLTELVMADLQEIEDQHLTFRGNSLATKATEAYLKLLGDGYLHETLGGLVRDVLSSSEECEVDPAKVCGGSGALQRQQGLLRQRVHAAWQRITRSAPGFPPELRALFHAYRQRLSGGQREEELCDNLISGSIFLRFLCPAILSPSLFGLTPEYPDERAARSLTLIAKTIQTLANFTRFGGKEGFMEFMNDFVEKEWSTMKAFLKQISSPSPREQASRDAPCVDLGLELAQLQGLLRECLPQLEGKVGGPSATSSDRNIASVSREVLLPAAASFSPAPGPDTGVDSTVGGSTLRVDTHFFSPDESAERAARQRGVCCQHKIENPPRAAQMRRVGSAEWQILDCGMGAWITQAPAVATAAAMGAVSGRAVSGPPLAFSNPVYIFESFVHSWPPDHGSSECLHLCDAHVLFMQQAKHVILKSLWDDHPVVPHKTTHVDRARTVERKMADTHLVLSGTNLNKSSLAQHSRLCLWPFPVRHLSRSLLVHSQERNKISRQSYQSDWMDVPSSVLFSLVPTFQYEHEVAQLKKLMGQLQRKLSLAETQLQQQLGADGWASGATGEGDQQQRRQEKDLQMKSIITRLITVEDELRREQREMQGMIRAKQQLIDAQERKIQTLDAANQRLLGALAQLRQHYQDQVVAEEPRRVAVHNGGGSPPAYRSSSC